MVVDKKRLFISYAREDKAFAEQLHEQLQKYGLDVWLDVKAVPPGADWAKLVAQDINRSDGLLLIMSPDSQASTNVEVEWQQMLSQGKPVIPLLYRPLSGGFHPAVDKLSYLDVSSQSESFLYKFRRILDGLKAQGFAVRESVTEGLYVTKTVQAEALPNPQIQESTFLVPLIITGIIFGAAIIAGLMISRNINLKALLPLLFSTSHTTATGTKATEAINSSTPTQTPTRATTSSSRIEVAFLPVRILSLSGIEIGNGTVRVYSPANVLSNESISIELELNLDQRYITPTPVGSITPIPLTRVTSIPRPAQFTATPREPIFEEMGVTAFQRMGATLYCPADRFTGCDQAADVTEARLIDWNAGGQWSWIIAPVNGVRGLQNLRVELWTIKRVNDGPEQADPIWDHSFQIEILAQSEPVDFFQVIRENIGAVIGLCGTVVAALIAAGYFSRRQINKGRSKNPAKAKTVAKKKVFISYRRIGGASTAQTIKERLVRKGADVFLDVHDINAGRFDEIIIKEIAGCDYFVLVLAPGTLDSEWVVKEIQHAIKTERTIIPVLVDGYRFGVNPTPDELKHIEKQNAVTLSPEYFEEGIDRLAKFVGLI